MPGRSEVPLTIPELEHMLSPRAIRDQARVIFERTVGAAGAATNKGAVSAATNKQQKGLFRYHPEKLEHVVKYVFEVTRKNYPDLNIPFHSRWGRWTISR